MMCVLQTQTIKHFKLQNTVSKEMVHS